MNEETIVGFTKNEHFLQRSQWSFLISDYKNLLAHCVNMTTPAPPLFIKNNTITV